MLDTLIIDNRQSIRNGLRQPYLHLVNALTSQYAEDLRNELLATSLWREQGDTTMSEKAARKTSDSFKYSRKGITLGDRNNPHNLMNLYKYLNSPDVLAWMSDVCGRKCDFFEGSATIFRAGDHISKHNDSYTRKTQDGKIQSRALTFNYWLTKDWGPEMGGRLIWEKPYAEIVPTFNTLVLFSPTSISQHWVEPVAEFVTAPRLAISGWFMTDRTNIKRDFNLKLD
jgi:Rps23 Pro-64 3,4-dihydroxylase Tpa1-like proline 4-hydroxylase